MTDRPPSNPYGTSRAVLGAPEPELHHHMSRAFVGLVLWEPLPALAIGILAFLQPVALMERPSLFQIPLLILRFAAGVFTFRALSASIGGKLRIPLQVLAVVYGCLQLALAAGVDLASLTELASYQDVFFRLCVMAGGLVLANRHAEAGWKWTLTGAIALLCGMQAWYSQQSYVPQAPSPAAMTIAVLQVVVGLMTWASFARLAALQRWPLATTEPAPAGD